MGLICGKCGSNYIVQDYEQVPGLPGHIKYLKCMKCGCRNIKEKKLTNSEISKSVNPANNISRSHSDENISESESKKQEVKIMAKPTCSREGCREPSEAAYLCADHFKDVYGITVDEYRSNKRHRTDSVAAVAARLKGEEPAPRVRAKPEAVQKAIEERKITARAPGSTQPPNAVEIVVTMSQERYEEFKAWAEKNYRTPELQAAYVINEVFGAAEKAA